MFYPGVGLLSAGVEGYASNGFRTGNLYAGLQGLAMWGWHWDFTGGDFRFSSNLVMNPFNNVYAPEISARGVRVVMKRVFSINAFNSTVIGVSTPLMRGWTLHAEAFKNTLNTALNPENIFLFGGSDLSVNQQLAAMNQWSFYFRISKQFHWGKGLPNGGAGSLEQYAASRVPLVGTVQGLVMEQSLGGPRPAANVGISIDGSRSVSTDSNGHYLFTDVPEGQNEIALDMEQLPTDYEPGPDPKTHAAVQPRGMVRADFSVYRLTYLAGHVKAPKGASIDNVVIRLKDTKLYTTPDDEGNFSFSNLHEGHYEVMIEEKTIPEGYIMASPISVEVDATAAKPADPLAFELKVKPVEEKPVKELQLKSQPIRIGGK